MRSEGKELLLAGFFSFLTAVLIGVFWAGGELSTPEFRSTWRFDPRPESMSPPSRSNASTGNQLQELGQSFGPFRSPTAGGGAISGPSTWSQTDFNWSSPWAFQPGIPRIGIPPTAADRGLPPKLLERPVIQPYASSPVEDRVPPPTQVEAPAFGLQAEPVEVAWPDPPDVLSPGLAGAPQNGSWAFAPKANGPEIALDPGDGNPQVTGDPDSLGFQINDQTAAEDPPGGWRLGQSDLGQQVAGDGNNLTPSVGEAHSGTQGDLPRESETGKSENEVGEHSAASRESASSGQPANGSRGHLPACRCGCIPRYRRICVPRPGWVPPVRLLFYIRQLLHCPHATPLAEGLSQRIEQLADAYELLHYELFDAGVSVSRFQVENIPEVSQSRADSLKLDKDPGNDIRVVQETIEAGEFRPRARLATIPKPPSGVGGGSARDQAAEAIARLERMREELLQAAEGTPDPHEATALRRAAHAVSRRLPIWRDIAAGRPYASELLEAIERYEQSNLPRDAAHLAYLVRTRASSVGEDDTQHQLEDFYRNSNLRWEVSENLLNRWLKPQPVRAFRIRDYILGRPVLGDSQTVAQVSFAMIPDPHRLRCRLVVTGQITSNTQSLAGPATFFDRVYGHFTGWKEIELTENGLKMTPPIVRAHQRVELRGLRTDFDGIPLLGLLAQDIALSQRERSMPEAQAEARQKLIARITQQFEAEAGTRLAKLQELVERRLLQPAHRLGLEPRLIQASTQPDRLIARWRLAASDQLGAHTPRPRIPEGVVASFQIHQSAVNNVLARLSLAGRMLTPTELQAEMAELLDAPELADDPSPREDVLIGFASVDPVLVHFQDGRVTIVLNIARLEKKPHVWENFQVRASYRPENVDGQTVFVRDGVVSLSGDSISLKDQLALRGIFSKRFSKERTWPVLPKLFRENPDFADLRLCHLIVEDGWLSWAVNTSGSGAPPSPRNFSPRVASTP